MIVDLHSHLVPGVDDGAQSVTDALEALRHLGAEGVSALVTTPHLLLPHLDSTAAVERELDRQRRAFDRLAAAAAREGLPSIGLGQEIWAPDATAIRRVLGRNGLGLGESDYLLVEFGFELTGHHRDVIEAVLEAGLRIVIAHPERYRYLPACDPTDTAGSWRETGALLQVNAGSLSGHYERSNPGARALAWQFIEQGLADLIATDHHASNRPVSPREAWDAMAGAGLEDDARRLMEETPRLIMRNEPVNRMVA